MRYKYVHIYKYIFNYVSCHGGSRHGLPSLSRCLKALPGPSEKQFQLFFKIWLLLLFQTLKENV